MELLRVILPLLNRDTFKLTEGRIKRTFIHTEKFYRTWANLGFDDEDLLRCLARRKKQIFRWKSETTSRRIQHISRWYSIF